MDTDKIEQALDILYQEGIKGYKPEYQEGIDRYAAIGQAISAVESHPLSFVKLAYEALEDQNNHSVCALLDLLYPDLHPSSVWGHYNELQRIQQLIGDRTVTVFSQWNQKKADYDLLKYRVRLVLEDAQS